MNSITRTENLNNGNIVEHYEDGRQVTVTTDEEGGRVVVGDCNPTKDNTCSAEANDAIDSVLDDLGSDFRNGAQDV